MIKKRNAQSSLEFLSTYAWAFVVILVTVSSLYYFGIFDFSRYLPQSCLFPLQFKCLDFGLKATEVRMILLNNLGEDICITSVQIASDSDTPFSCTLAPQPQGSCALSESQWSRASEKTMLFTSCAGGGYAVDERAQLKVSINYYALNTPSKPVHLISGKVDGRVTI